MTNRMITAVLISFLLAVSAASACGFASEFEWGNVTIESVEFVETPFSNIVVCLSDVLGRVLTNVSARVESGTTGPVSADSTFALPQGSPPDGGIPRITFKARGVRAGCAVRSLAMVAGVDCRATAAGPVFMNARTNGLVAGGSNAFGHEGDQDRSYREAGQ